MRASLFTPSTGLEFNGLHTKFEKTGILGFAYLSLDNYFVTKDSGKYNELVLKMNATLTTFMGGKHLF